MFRGVHTTVIRDCLSGQVRASHIACELYPISFSLYGQKENTIGLGLRSPGLRTAGQRVPQSSAAVPSRTAVRRDSLRTVSRAGDRVFLVIPRTFYFLPLFSMDTRKKNSDSETEVNSPIDTFFEDDVSASVFSRDVKTKNGMKTFYSVSFSRSYRDSKGARRYVKTFDVEDLSKVVAVGQKAGDLIRKLQTAAA